MNDQSFSEAGADSQAPAPFVYTDSDHSALVFMIPLVSNLVMLTIITSKVLLHKIGSARYVFDYLVVGSAATLSVQTALTLWSARLGLGVVEEQLDLDVVVKIRLIQYIASLLSITALVAAKCSLNLVIIAVNDLGYMYYASRALLAFLLLSSIGSFFATTFQCPLPTPWLPCRSADTIQRYTAIMNIVTDLMLCGLATAMVWVLKDQKTKIFVIALFACRIMCPITLMPGLVHQTLSSSSNYTWVAASPIIWFQVSYNLSIITACIPSMKAVFDAFSGNTLTVAIDTPFELVDHPQKTGFEMSLRTKLESEAGHEGSSHTCSSTMGGNSSTTTSLTESVPMGASYCLDIEDKDSSTDSKQNNDLGWQHTRVRRLTDDVIHIREDVKVYVTDAWSSPPSGPHGIWVGAKYQHSCEIEPKKGQM